MSDCHIGITAVDRRWISEDK